MTRLTRTMQPIIEAIGFDAATSLVNTFGGGRVYVAKTPRSGSVLVACIGLGNATALAAHIGAGDLEIPLCNGWLAAMRRERVVLGAQAGATHAALAAQHGYSERYIRTILRDAQADGLMPAPNEQDAP